MLAALLFIPAGCSEAIGDDGPLFVGDGHAVSAGSRDVGAIVSFGSPKVRNPTDDQMKVVDAVLKSEQGNPGVTVTDVYVLKLTGLNGTVMIGDGFPPVQQANHPFIPAKGAILEANSWYQIMFVMKVDTAGTWLFPEVELTYEADGETYTVTVPDGLRLCAPRTTDCQASNN